MGIHDSFDYKVVDVEPEGVHGRSAGEFENSNFDAGWFSRLGP
jgi:hypothetical protein